RRAVRADALDQVGAAEDQAARLRAAQPLAAAEDGQVGARLRVAPEVGDRRDLGRAVNHDRDAARVGDLHDRLEWPRAVGERAGWIIASTTACGMIEPPSPVSVAEALTTRRRPRSASRSVCVRTARY